MTGISIFSGEQIVLLASLPYRIGVWISDTDDEDGETDDRREMKALAVCIKMAAKQYDGPGIVDDILRETLAREKLWSGWAEGAFDVLPDCKKAVALLQDKSGLQEAKNYRAAMMEIAVTVAQAYGEFSSFDEIPEDEGILGKIVGKVVGGFSNLSKDDANHPMNVSAAEDSAISQLSAALKVSE